MSEYGDALRERFGTLRNRIVVPEFKGILPDDSQGEPAIYSRPFTVHDSKNLQKFIDGENAEGFAMLIVRKAQDENGEKLFDLTDRKTLTECVEAEVIARIGTAIVGAESGDEDPAGNSDDTQS